MLGLPYARFTQELRLAADAAREADRSEWTRTAFIAWNTRASFAGKSAGTFKRFLKDLGLGPKNELSQDEVAYWRERANENERRAFAALESRG